MRKRTLSLVVALLSCIWAYAQENRDCPKLQYHNGQITKLCGKGELYNFGSDTKQNLAHIYYFFTDEPFIYISDNYRPGGTNGFDNLAIIESNADTGEYWFHKDNGIIRLAKRVVSFKEISNAFGLHWNNRVEVLFDTKDGKNKNKNCTAELIVLPIPPLDKGITHCTLENKSINNDTLTGTLIVRRTGRIVFDRILVDGKPPLKTSYNPNKNKPEGYSRDTPYYRANPYAKVVIKQPVAKKQTKITLTVSYRKLEPDGSITHICEDIIIRIRSSFPYAIVAVAIALVAAIIVLLRLIIHSMNNDKHDGSSEMIASLQTQMADYKAQLAKYKAQIALLESQKKAPSYELDDFNRRCSDAINSMTSTYQKLNKRGCRDEAEEVRQLMIKIFLITNEQKKSTNET